MTKALVLHDHRADPQIETIELDALRSDEILIDVRGVGICHTDITAIDGLIPLPLPIVLGHEGSGVVAAVGESVAGLRPGDHVVATFDTCGECVSCTTGQPAYCEIFAALNYFGTRLDGSAIARQGETDVHGNWFGQSTFATQAIVRATNAIRVRKDSPIELLGPLGCSMQTGAGTVFRVLDAKANQGIAIFGLGGVGLAALMAAVDRECAPIIGIDPNQQRRELATAFGATQTFDPNATDDLVWDILEIGAPGLHYSIDCVGTGEVIRQALEVLRTPGTCATLGLAGLKNDITIDQGHLLLGRTLTGVIEGNAQPDSIIPELIELWRLGRFPFERLIETYKFHQIDDALADFRTGKVVKPVIVIDPNDA